MPHHKAALKQLKRDKVAKLRNSAARSRMRTAIKKVRQAETKEEAQNLLVTAVSIIDKTVSKGIIHKNTGSRYKSRLAKFVNSLPSEPKDK